MFIYNLLQNPREFLLSILLILPAAALSISAHESAHGYVAERCGDPTARLMNRISLNPVRHFDLVGMLMMLLIGVGYAKPVPVNPRNFRRYRRDDILVSVAGIAMNLILAFVFSFFVFGFVAVFIRSTDLFAMKGTLLDSVYARQVNEFFRYAIGYSWDGAGSFGQGVIAPESGYMLGYLFDMLSYFVTLNIGLAVFNLIPLPPLDGYHVLNDLVLKRPLFADLKAQRIGQLVLILLVTSGAFGKLLQLIEYPIFEGLGLLWKAVFGLFGLI